MYTTSDSEISEDIVLAKLEMIKSTNDNHGLINHTYVGHMYFTNQKRTGQIRQFVLVHITVLLRNHQIFPVH